VGNVLGAGGGVMVVAIYGGVIGKMTWDDYARVWGRGKLY